MADLPSCLQDFLKTLSPKDCDFVKREIFPTPEHFADIFNELVNNVPLHSSRMLFLWHHLFLRCQASEERQLLFWKFFMYMRIIVKRLLHGEARRVFLQKCEAIAGTLAADLPIPSLSHPGTR